MTIENLILESQVHTLFPETNTMSKLYCKKLKCLLPSIMKMFEEMFCMLAEMFKQSLI